MQKLSNHIKQLKKDSIIADIAIDFIPELEVTNKWDILNRYVNAGFSYLAIALAGDLTSLETTVQYISRTRSYIRDNMDNCIIVNTVDDIKKAKEKNKLALGFWFQGSNPLANDINMIETYYRIGIRSILLCYNTRNAIGDGILEEPDAGLSKFGYKVIEEMNRVGMLIDMSHGGIKTSMDVIEASQDPIIFSHSNTQGINNHIRNLTDEQIKSLAKNNGVIGINGMALILGEEIPSINKFVDHIDYISDLTGSCDNISLGLDLVYFEEVLPLFFEKSGLKYPKGYLGSMKGLQPESIDELIEELIKRDYSDLNIKNILGGNFYRVASGVWKQ